MRYSIATLCLLFFTCASAFINITDITERATLALAEQLNHTIPVLEAKFDGHLPRPATLAYTVQITIRPQSATSSTDTSFAYLSDVVIYESSSTTSDFMLKHSEGVPTPIYL